MLQLLMLVEQAIFFKNVMPRPAYGALSVTALVGLMTLTFNLLTSKFTGHPCDGLPSSQF